MKRINVLIALIFIFLAGCKPSMNIEEEKKVVNFDKEVMVNKKGDLYTIPLQKIMQVLPLRGNVPALENPKYVAPSEGDRFLAPDDRVIGLDRAGRRIAYPVKIMRWHQVVNETVGGEPVLISYDPISDMAAGYVRTALGKTMTFKTSDKAYNSNPLLEDKETKTSWSQFMGAAVFGRLAGQTIAEIPLLTASWGDWKRAFPETEVLSIETGHRREYDNNIYADYYKADYLLFDVENLDSRYNNKKHVYGVREGGAEKAYPADLMKKGTRIEDRIGGIDMVISVDDYGIVRAEKKEGEDKLPVRRLLWFSWAAFYPKTALYTESGK